jgi:hypothetical protein
MVSDHAIKKVLRSILRRFESGEAEQAQQAREQLRILAEQLAVLTPSRQAEKRRLSPLLRALWQARNAGDKDAAFHIQSGLKDWLERPLPRPEKEPVQTGKSTIAKKVRRVLRQGMKL